MQNTVSLDKAVERLISIARIEISTDDIKNIKLAKDWRNTLMHYQMDFDPDAMKIVFVKLFGFLNSFEEKNLGRDLSKILKKNSWDQITQYYHYTKELADRAKIVIKEKSYNKVLYCSECGEETFIADNEINTCMTCKHKENVVSCWQCGFLLVESDAHKVYWGIITDSNHPEDIGKELNPFLCERCYEKDTKEREE
jgi:hypothetical protein